MKAEAATDEQIKLAAFGDAVEASGDFTSIYYRLLPQIVNARAAIAKAKAQGGAS